MVILLSGIYSIILWNMETLTAVNAMSALAHEGRLGLFRRLIQAGTDGLAVGELVEACGLNFSTVSAQLLVLANADLVSKDRRGRSFIYFANYSSIRNLLSYLMKDCCQGKADIIKPLAGIAGDATECSPRTGAQQ